MDKQVDFKRFLTVLTGIADYYGKELSEGVITLYWQGLAQYDIQAVEKALWEHTQNPDNGQFMPKIADVTRNLQGRTVDQASVALSKVEKAVRQVGPYQDVAFDDPIIHRVIEDMGGWVKFGTYTEEEWQFVGNQFRTRYQGFKMRGEIPEYMPLLTGIANASNRSEGHRLNPPVLIGNQEKAMQVISGGSNVPAIGITRATHFSTPPAQIGHSHDLH